MGNKKKMKPGTNELIRRTDILLHEVDKLNNWSEYLHRLFTEYIVWKGDEDKFKKHLKEVVDADTKDSGQLQKSTSTDSPTEGGKQKVKKSTSRKTKPTKGTGESGAIGL